MVHQACRFIQIDKTEVGIESYNFHDIGRIMFKEMYMSSRLTEKDIVLILVFDEISSRPSVHANQLYGRKLSQH